MTSNLKALGGSVQVTTWRRETHSGGSTTGAKLVILSTLGSVDPEGSKLKVNSLPNLDQLAPLIRIRQKKISHRH